MVECAGCVKQDECETYALMQKVATAPTFEAGAQRGILERMEELAEYCTEFKQG